MLDLFRQQSLARSRRIGDLPARRRPVRSFRGALRAASPRCLILEHKRASPSVGRFTGLPGIRDVVRSHVRSGAAALSILTEPDHFGGRLPDLTVAGRFDLPILRKDFLVDPRQVIESHAYGADAILVILAMVDDTEAGDLIAEATRLGLDVLVECHDEDEIGRAVGLGARIIGVNNRNLTSLEVDVTNVSRLLPVVPPDVLFVAESGYSPQTATDLAARVDAVLIGTSVLEAPCA